jgi:hypothetical protein
MHLLLWDQAAGKVARKRVSTTPWKIDACPMTYYSISPIAGGYLAVWPTKGDVYYARLDEQGQLLAPVEVKTPGTAGMRSGVVASADAAGNTLVAWKKNGELGWQLFGKDGRPAGESGTVGTAGTAKSPGNGVAGALVGDGKWILFR